jgi:hypothetical protein
MRTLTAGWAASSITQPVTGTAPPIALPTIHCAKRVTLAV